MYARIPDVQYLGHMVHIILTHNVAFGPPESILFSDLKEGDLFYPPSAWDVSHGYAFIKTSGMPIVVLMQGHQIIGPVQECSFSKEQTLHNYTTAPEGATVSGFRCLNNTRVA
jgi:hypothetical protein